MRQRTEKMLKDLKRKAHVSMETFRILQETYREMNGEPVALCRGQACYNILTQIPIYIEDGDLLAGNGSAYPGGLEIDYANGIWTKDEIDALREEGYTFNPEDEPLLYRMNEQMAPYSIADGVMSALTEDSYLMPFLRSGMGSTTWTSLQRGRQDLNCTAQGGLNLSPARVMVALDYEKAMTLGLNQMIKDCDAQLSQIRYQSGADYERSVYIKAMKKALEGIVAYAGRFAALAGQMAEQETNETRRMELERMARICSRVPALPAETFREALQTYWFIFLTVACPNIALGMGRLDQILYPYYKKDIEEGRITDDEVLELLELLRIKDCQLGVLNSKDHRARSSVDAKWHNIIIGGVKPDGSDATNELSYLILEAAMNTHTPNPTITVRVADSTPAELMRKGLECVRNGLSMPAFVSDDSVLAYLSRFDLPVEDARNYTLAGCLDVVIPGKSRILACAMFMTTMILDVFLNHGINRNNGDQLGHDPGDLDQWSSYAEFEAAFKEEFRYFLTLMTEYQNMTITVLQNEYPEPIKTPFMYRGIEDGTDYQKKRMPFENGGAICPVGLVNLGDSLYVIKKLVYEEKALKLSELKEAMEADWKGYEELHRRCLNLPKYGNGVDEVDEMVADMYGFFADVCASLPCASVPGAAYLGSAVSIFGHAPGGAITGATPDGRCCFETLADAGASPMRGRDTNGPLAVLHSAAKIPHDRYQAVLFNMKFSPDVLQTEKDLDKLAAMLRVYFKEKGRQIQLNIVNPEELKDARVHPDQHEDLLVRVAGYSAYYVQLTERLQDEILARTSNGL